ncbi:protein sorting system archaetidylserine decarboxylase [Natrinema gelatinilyticum]|uniref:protein sorting system archaetidylserine decarboxylase n=1 Tax=Natrinema gelatinilyticum TaxID=2961571 RepID=UPI0020C2387D|nr:protein sorting system archaetidylserine decarboxylase [Natrinema gelatinilyticum]
MNIAPGGWKYAIFPLLAAPFALLISVTASLVALAIGVGTLVFFRDPDRSPPPTGVVSPADGTVSVLREEGDRVRLGVFMNLWHVHVVRSPFAGRITDVEHVSGANRPAFSKESDRNERVHVHFVTESPHLPAEGDGGSVSVANTNSDASATDGEESADADSNARGSPPAEPAPHAAVTLIAGAFARRIYPYVERDDGVERGERIGHIAFGSRVDLLFPKSVELADVAVDIGDSMTAGETVVLELPDVAAGGEFGLDTDVDGGDA